MSDNQYTPESTRYEKMIYRRCGASGIQLPSLSLGLWHNFGFVDNFQIARNVVRTAFDMGITHFDLANNYGPPPGSAEENFGKILSLDLISHRDELIISSKAGYNMWPGPYGEWGSRKYLIASCDQSLKRLGLDYLDIFYSHRFDPNTPLEETMGALDQIVRKGKALYVGISNYNPDQTKDASRILKSLGTPCLIHQPRYSMFDRTPEKGLLDVIGKEGLGAIAFSPLAQGLLTNRYLSGIPENSRAANPTSPFLTKEQITAERLEAIKKLNDLALKRGQTLAQMAISWLLKDDRITSVLVGASSKEQLIDSIGAINNIKFNNEELIGIEHILKQAKPL
jgi:L-glyceraldehyde 3-phosphate reductase